MSLRDSLRRLSGESLVYGLGQVSGRAVNLLLVPILTRVLLRQQYGVSELVTGYSARSRAFSTSSPTAGHASA